MEISVALDKLRTICSKQEKAPADITNLLKKWDVDTELHKQIIEKLRLEKFIDDRRYASAFLRDKVRFDHWGFIKVRLMLQQKKIDRNIVNEVIAEYDRNEYRKMIAHELSKKRKNLKGTPYEIWAKLARYGSSKGYEMQDMEDFLGTAEE